jgi:hypothetical protein
MYILRIILMDRETRIDQFLAMVKAEVMKDSTFFYVGKEILPVRVIRQDLQGMETIVGQTTFKIIIG